MGDTAALAGNTTTTIGIPAVGTSRLDLVEPIKNDNGAVVPLTSNVVIEIPDEKVIDPKEEQEIDVNGGSWAIKNGGPLDV